MEKLQGPINPSFLEQENGAMSMLMMSEFLTSFEEHQQDPYGLIPTLEDSNKMPFLQMLQGVESSLHNPPFFPLLHENNFQLLLRLQNPNPNPNPNPKPLETCFELDSCITTINNNVNNNNNYMDMHSPAKSQISPTPGPGQPAESRAVVERSKRGVAAAAATKEQRRKRKRSTRPSKNKEEVETQRMTHIAVERNRRRQMNEHLNALRSLMPPSYIQRGDQASIIGGAIDFVKELEQLLQSLQAQKRMRQSEETGDISASSSTSSSSNLLSNLFMNPPSSSTTTSSSSPLTQQFRYSHEEVGNGNGNGNGNGEEGGKGNEGEYSAENRSGVADIEVVVIQSHVNLKIHCQRRPGQLLKAIVALEQLRLSVLHLNITSFHNLVHYSFNLKIEEDCKLGSADEVATAVHQIFSLINIS